MNFFLSALLRCFFDRSPRASCVFSHPSDTRFYLSDNSLMGPLWPRLKKSRCRQSWKKPTAHTISDAIWSQPQRRKNGIPITCVSPDNTNCHINKFSVNNSPRHSIPLLFHLILSPGHPRVWIYPAKYYANIQLCVCHRSLRGIFCCEVIRRQLIDMIILHQQLKLIYQCDKASSQASSRDIYDRRLPQRHIQGVSTSDSSQHHWRSWKIACSESNKSIIFFILLFACWDVKLQNAAFGLLFFAKSKLKLMKVFQI